MKLQFFWQACGVGKGTHGAVRLCPGREGRPSYGGNSLIFMLLKMFLKDEYMRKHPLKSHFLDKRVKFE